jgi:hypothetical protein
MSYIPPVNLPVPIDSVNLNMLKPDVLFKYINVRNPIKQSDGIGLRYFIPNVYDELSSTDLSTIQADTETLFDKLFAHKSAGITIQQSDVNAYKGKSTFITTPDEYISRYPELTSFISWLDVNSVSTSNNEIAARINSEFGIALSDFVSSIDFQKLQCTFWDNLFASVYSANSPFLVTLACKYLGALHVCKVVNDASGTPGEDKEPSLAYVYRAKTLVPKWIYEVFIANADDADEGFGDQTPESETNATVQTQFNHLSIAIKEIRSLILKRTEAVARNVKEIQHDFETATRDFSAEHSGTHQSTYTDMYDGLYNQDNAYEIQAGVSLGFSTSTTNLLTLFYPSWTALNLNNVLEKLQEEVQLASAKLGSTEREYSVRIGSTIISKKELCANMTDNDPCAIFERKNFASKGSFTNSALIGDLLLTEQQLIKYDAGEVAHVEAVMQGLEKLRTHRRLDRIESTNTFVHESENETERETQTTERFSMEKETSNVVEQQFQVSAGVNVSAQYGVVNVVSSLDSSYGYSQLQAQQSATNFSRDVTNRALTRVKELVRETKTVTVINEIEETSVNKITNATTDHINGVYRWLDKFYLNKVINYGKRLMFEFSIPEPANFYIFRKMVQPQTGATVEKPAIPSQTAGPDGLKLTSPTVLTDTNYAFWLSQYDVANADVPPQEYIRVSKAYKNEYTTLQNADQHDSFSANIEIPADYEAVSFDIYSMNFWWGEAIIEGAVGTTLFGRGGPYTNLPLSNIRNTVGISMLSKGMNYELNVVIKARRTAESFDAWRLATYSKVMEAYKQKQKAYDDWINTQEVNDAFGFTGAGNNPLINREIEREELKKRAIEMFTGQRYESFDAATNGIQNVSGYPEILFNEAIKEGNLVKFFEQAFEWEHMTYIFYPYFWGRKSHWLTMKNIEDTSDPLFTKFLQAGQARVVVPARPDFENYLLMFNLMSNAVSQLGCAWNFNPSLFGSLGISNEFSPGVTDPVYMSVTAELLAAQGMNEDNGVLIGAHVQKVPTNLVYAVPNSHTSGAPLPGLPDNTADPDIAPYL